MRVLRPLVFALAFVACLPAFAAGPDPAAAVEPLYVRGHKELFTATSRDLTALWARCQRRAKRTHDEMGALDFDVVTNSQLGFESIKGHALLSRPGEGARAVIDVKLSWAPDVTPRAFPSDDVVSYTLVLEGGAWKIDEVTSTVDGKPWSLRKLLSDYLKS